MLNRIICTRLVVISSLSLLTLGAMVTSPHQASAAPSHTSATAQQRFLLNGVFGWD